MNKPNFENALSIIQTFISNGRVYIFHYKLNFSKVKKRLIHFYIRFIAYLIVFDIIIIIAALLNTLHQSSLKDFFFFNATGCFENNKNKDEVFFLL